MEDGKQVVRRVNIDYQFVFTGGFHHVELFYIKSKKKIYFYLTSTRLFRLININNVHSALNKHWNIPSQVID